MTKQQSTGQYETHSKAAQPGPKPLARQHHARPAEWRHYQTYVDLLRDPRWLRAYNAGARPQRLLWASTGSKDPKASDILYIKALASPFTVNTMPEGTLKAFADHGDPGSVMAPDGGNCEAVLAEFAKAGINVDDLAAQLQDEGAKSFVKSWNELMAVIASKSDALKKAA